MAAMVCTALLSAAFATVATTPSNRTTAKMAVRYFMGFSSLAVTLGCAHPYHRTRRGRPLYGCDEVTAFPATATELLAACEGESRSCAGRGRLPRNARELPPREIAHDHRAAALRRPGPGNPVPKAAPFATCSQPSPRSRPRPPFRNRDHEAAGRYRG